MSKGCFDAAKSAIPDASAEDLRMYAAQVLNNAKSQPGTLKSNLKSATEEVNKQQLDRMYQEAQIKLNNIDKVNQKISIIKSGKANTRELLVRQNDSLSDNVESYQRSDINRLSDKLFGSLDSKVLSYVAKSSNDAEVLKVLDGERGSPEAERLSNTISSYTGFRNDELINSGAMLKEDLREDRFLKNNHDASRMMAGGRNLVQRAKSFFKEDGNFAKQRWVNTIKSKLDLEKTFKNSDAWQLDESGSEPDLKIDQDKVDKILSNTYDNITTGKSEIMTRSAAVNDADALAKKSHMFFVFKNWKSWGDYNSQYGTGDLFSALMADVHASGNKTGITRFMGDNPDRAYTAMRDAQLKQAGMKNDALWWRNTDFALREVTGANKAVVSPGIAQFFGNIRALSSMARLGSLVISSTTDTNIAAGYARRWGINYGKAFKNQWETLAKQYTDEDVKNFAKLFHTQLQSHMGYTGKFIDSANLGAFTSKFSMGYYKLTMMHGWDSGNRIGLMHSIAQHLGDMAEKGFNDLPQALQYQLNKFNISSDEWDAVRKNKIDDLITTDSANQLSDDDIKDLQSKLGISSQSVYDTRNDLYRKLYSVFDVASQNAILTPGAWERAMMSQGTQPGDIKGELTRFIMQFKGFPLSYINRQLIQGFQDADATQSKLGWALSTFGYILPLSYMSTMLYYASQGQSMPDPEQMDYNQNLDFWAGIAMPGLGALSMILDPSNQNQNLLSSLATTPSYRFFNDAISAPLATVTGSPDKGYKDLKKALQYIVPGMTLPIISPYIKSALGDNPYLQPGQNQLFGA